MQIKVTSKAMQTDQLISMKLLELALLVCKYLL